MRDSPHLHGGDAMIPHPGAAQATGSPGAGPAASRILIAGGEPKIRSLIGGALAAAGYVTDLASTRTEGLRRAMECHYDLIILDLGMPDLDGRDVLERMLSARPGQAVMVLSGWADVAARVDCLERGAQDYLAKPFSLAELLARVRLRVRDSAYPRGEVIEAGQLRLDLGRLTADTGHGPVPLTRLEFLLLRELVGHAGQPVPKGKLLAAVWGYDFDPGSNVVDVCVRRLRSKLGFDLITTVRGEGYRLAGQLPARPHGKPPPGTRGEQDRQDEDHLPRDVLRGQVHGGRQEQEPRRRCRSPSRR